MEINIMLNLFGAINPDSSVFWLLVILGALLIVEIAIFAIMMLHNRRRDDQPEQEPRKLIGLTLDTTIVKREYKLGEQFDPAGLIATLYYNGEPFEETLDEFTILTPELIEQLAEEGKTPEDFEGCLVYPPDLSVVGKPTVTVAYKSQNAAFAISVVEQLPEPAPEPKIERTLIGISLDTDSVRKEYIVGEEFDPTGLVVYGNYNLEPSVEAVSEGYEILPVDMSRTGDMAVTVSYGGFTVGFQITVNPVVETPEPVVAVEQPEVVATVAPVVEEESHEGGTLRYDKSFTARIIQSDDEIKQWYIDLKNDLLSYKKVKDRMSWKRESYRLGRAPFAKLGFRGKTLCVFLPLNVAELEGSKYKVEDVSDNVAYADTPLMYRIKNDRRVKYAKELIALVAENYNTPHIERESVDYYMPYEGVLELINKGLIKRNIKSKEEEAIFDEKKQKESEAGAEEVAAADNA